MPKDPVPAAYDPALVDRLCLRCPEPDPENRRWRSKIPKWAWSATPLRNTSKKRRKVTSRSSASTAALSATKANASATCRKARCPWRAGIANLVPFREKTRPADPALPVFQHRRSGNGHQQRSCGIVEQLCHKIRIPHPYVDLYGLPATSPMPSAPSPRWRRHAGPEVPRAPERRADRRL